MKNRPMFLVELDKMIEKDARPGYVFSQQAFAEAVGLSEPTVSRLRRGPVSSIHAHVVQKIADYWKVKPNDILKIIMVDEAEALGG
jgi:DNA-binding Xre family transcriptional regulator